MTKPFTLKEFILIGVAITLISCAPTMKSTPKKTIDTYIEGYRRGDEDLVLSTLHESGGIAPITHGEDQNYRILEKLLVLETSDIKSKPGDIHMIVRLEFNTGEPRQIVANFW